MTKTSFLLVPLTFVIIIGLLIAGGWAIHRIGWSEGYRMGQLVAGGQEASTVPYAPYGLSYLGLFLTVGLVLLLLLATIGKLFCFWAWKAIAGPWMMAGGPRRMARARRHKHWARHWHRHHGPMPPWGWEEPSEKDAEPDAEADDAQAGS